ncbi:hypothetical protein NBRC116590_04260 [Pelagimonas sp. KU-00592-HH]|uniref:phosphoadenosine phosphosulfate reductase n=1 Tax=Pelagimonas sp. KU-00592-HH TaxID=3127651 RepID=UPI0031029AD2
MQDAPNGFDTPMLGLKPAEWIEKLEEIAEEHGYYQPLGAHHHSTFVEDKPLLLVTFETIESIQDRADTGQPLGFELVRELGWSHLCILSEGQSWFRDPAVFAYFDRLVDDGFFDEFERVIFYGAGPGCAYAAATYSVCAPGATVVALQPQATLDPQLTGWDTRFRNMRKTSFTTRYGYAPDMTEAAEKVFICYDPMEREDAIHAALFRAENTTLLPLPNMGDRLEDDFFEMQILFRLLAKAGKGELDARAAHRLFRARRTHVPYLDRLLLAIEKQKRPLLKAYLCANVVQRLDAPRFRRKLELLENAASRGKLAG